MSMFIMSLIWIHADHLLLSIAAFWLQEQNIVVAMETVWPAKPKIKYLLFDFFYSLPALH